MCDGRADTIVTQADYGQRQDVYWMAVWGGLLDVLVVDGGSLDCHSRRLTWCADAQAFLITNGEDDEVYVTDLLAALRELRGPVPEPGAETVTAAAPGGEF